MSCLYLLTSLHLLLKFLVCEDGDWEGGDEKSISHVTTDWITAVPGQVSLGKAPNCSHCLAFVLWV